MFFMRVRILRSLGSRIMTQNKITPKRTITSALYIPLGPGLQLGRRRFWEAGARRERRHSHARQRREAQRLRNHSDRMRSAILPRALQVWRGVDLGQRRLLPSRHVEYITRIQKNLSIFCHVSAVDLSYCRLLSVSSNHIRGILSCHSWGYPFPICNWNETTKKGNNVNLVCREPWKKYIQFCLKQISIQSFPYEKLCWRTEKNLFKTERSFEREVAENICLDLASIMLGQAT